jgi:hypothetical protein
MIDTCINEILKKAKKAKKIEEISENAVGKIKQIKEIFSKDKNFIEVIDFFMMLRKLENLKTERIGEFRKNVALKIQFRGQEINVNLEQLKIYAEMIEKFIKTTKQYLTEEK